MNQSTTAFTFSVGRLVCYEGGVPSDVPVNDASVLPVDTRSKGVVTLVARVGAEDPLIEKENLGQGIEIDLSSDSILSLAAALEYKSWGDMFQVFAARYYAGPARNHLGKIRDVKSTYKSSWMELVSGRYGEIILEFGDRDGRGFELEIDVNDTVAFAQSLRLTAFPSPMRKA